MALGQPESHGMSHTNSELAGKTPHFFEILLFPYMSPPLKHFMVTFTKYISYPVFPILYRISYHKTPYFTDEVLWISVFIGGKNRH